MLKKYMVFIIAFMLALAWGYVAVQDGGYSKGELGHSIPPQSNNANAVDPIEAQISKMSLAEKVGQLVIVGLEGYENDAQAKQLLEKYHVGGFILFKRNISNAEQTLALTNSLKESNAVNKIPLFIAIDEEGGSVTRLPEEFVKLPTSQRIGELDNSQLSFRVGSVIGEAIKSIGFNLDFAPVLDINSNPNNPVIGDRAFGDNAGLVTRLGIQTMKGLQSQNIIPVVKHFPGHGDTAEDSHLGLPVVNNDLQRLKNFELLPFAAALENQVEAIMIAHILLPQIDPDNPATLSPAIITGLLRQEIGFDGVVITDDMTMGAIMNNYEIGAAAVKAINAGSDIVLVCHDYEQAKAVIGAIQEAAASGAISPDRIDESVYRVLKLKQKYALDDQSRAAVDPETINNKINTLYHEFF